MGNLLHTIGGNQTIWSGLTSYWRLDEGTGTVCADSKGTRTLTNNTSWWSASGKKNSCFSAANSRYAYSANDVFTNAQVVSGSFSCWFKGNTIPSSGFGAKLFSVEGWIMIYVADSTGYLLALSDGGSSAPAQHSINVCDNVWHLGVMTWHNNLCSLYLDNRTVATHSMVSSPTPDSTAGRCFAIGAAFNNSQNYTGLIDEVGFWSNRELSATEVLNLYNIGQGIYY